MLVDLVRLICRNGQFILSIFTLVPLKSALPVN